MTGSLPASREGRAVVPLAIVAAAIVLFVAGAVVGAVDGRSVQALAGLVAIAVAVFGWLILRRRPGNRIGWILCAAAIPAAVLNAGDAYLHRAVITAPGSLPLTRAVEAMVNASPLPLIGLMVALLPQVFPTGVAVSRRWRPAVWTAWAYIVIGTLSNLVSDEDVQGLPHVRNPIAISTIQPILGVFQIAAGVFLLISVIAGASGLVVRWRRSSGDERQQINWFVADRPGADPDRAARCVSRRRRRVHRDAAVVDPVAIGVAVLRYRLYDLDIVLNRVLVYAMLSAMTASITWRSWYSPRSSRAGAVAWACRSPRPSWPRRSSLPLRTRVQHIVDRLFYGDRARPYEALTRLGRTLEHAPAPDAIAAGVPWRGGRGAAGPVRGDRVRHRGRHRDRGRAAARCAASLAALPDDLSGRDDRLTSSCPGGRRARTSARPIGGCSPTSPARPAVAAHAARVTDGTAAGPARPRDRARGGAPSAAPRPARRPRPGPRRGHARSCTRRRRSRGLDAAGRSRCSPPSKTQVEDAVRGHPPAGVRPAPAGPRRVRPVPRDSAVRPRTIEAQRRRRLSARDPVAASRARRPAGCGRGRRIPHRHRGDHERVPPRPGRACHVRLELRRRR